LPKACDSKRTLSVCTNFLKFGQLCPTIKAVRGSEFIKRALKLAKEKGLEARVDKKRGKGSHVTLYFGDRRTIVRNPKDELKTGTLNAMCKQLGIDNDEI